MISSGGIMILGCFYLFICCEVIFLYKSYIIIFTAYLFPLISLCSSLLLVIDKKTYNSIEMFNTCCNETSSDYNIDSEYCYCIRSDEYVCDEHSDKFDPYFCGSTTADFGSYIFPYILYSIGFWFFLAITHNYLINRRAKIKTYPASCNQCFDDKEDSDISTSSPKCKKVFSYISYFLFLIYFGLNIYIIIMEQLTGYNLFSVVKSILPIIIGLFLLLFNIYYNCKEKLAKKYNNELYSLSLYIHIAAILMVVYVFVGISRNLDFKETYEKCCLNGDDNSRVYNKIY